MSLENVVKQNLLESPSKRWLNFVRESKKKIHMFIQKMKQEMYKKPTYMTTEAHILITMGKKGLGTILYGF